MTPAMPPAAIVRASAGSGKTHLLAIRYVGLLRSGVDPGEILAATFTRKAAGEIAERIIGRLAAAVLDEEEARRLGEEVDGRPIDGPEARRLLGRLAASLHRAAPSTLDSVFHRLALRFRTELGLPRRLVLAEDDDPAAAAARAEAIRAALEAEPRRLDALLRDLFPDRFPAATTGAIDEVVKRLLDIGREAPEEAWRALRPEGKPLSQAERADAAATLAALEREAKDKNYRTAYAKIRAAVEAGDPDAILEVRLVKKALDGEAEYSRKPIPPEAMEVCRRLGEHAVYLLLDRLARETAAIRRLLGLFEEAYESARARLGFVRFADIPHLLAGLTGGPGRLDRFDHRLDATLRHLLLDEFQDTSRMQWAVVRPWAVRAVAEAKAGRDGSFFAVGDAKQAIYGWRGGCAGLLLGLPDDLGLGDDAVSSTETTRRLAPPIVDTVNRVFDRVDQNPGLGEMGEDARAWAGRFRPHAAHDAGRPGYVVLETAPAPGEKTIDEAGDEEDDEDGSHVASTLRRAARVVVEIVDAAPAARVGVLVRANKEADMLVQILRGLAIAASGEGGAALADDPGVTAILAGLLLADHPGHSAAAFEAARSPLGPTIFPGGHGGAAPSRAEARAASERIRADLLRRGLPAVVADWARAIAPARDARGAGRLERLVEEAERWGRRDSLRPSRFVAHVRRTAVEDPEAARVRVMTIHKAKGLEFDAVVLPVSKARMGDVFREPVWVVRPSPAAPPEAIVRRPRAGHVALSPLLGRAFRQERERRLEDDLSALYVAMTRAKHELRIVIPALPRTSKGVVGKKGWEDGSAAALLRRALARPGLVEEPAGGEVLYEAGDTTWRARFQAVAGPAAAPPAVAAPVVLAEGGAPRRSRRRAAPSAGGEIDLEGLLSIERPEDRSRGERIHDLLGRIEWLDGAAADATDDADLAAALARPVVRAALARPALAPDEEAEVWRERPFAVLDGDLLVEGRFDRLVVVRRRETKCPVRADLVEWKTDRVRDAAAARARAKVYLRQLEAYRRAAARLLGLGEADIRAAIVFTEVGVRVDL